MLIDENIIHDHLNPTKVVHNTFFLIERKKKKKHVKVLTRTYKYSQYLPEGSKLLPVSVSTHHATLG